MFVILLMPGILKVTEMKVMTSLLRELNSNSLSQWRLYRNTLLAFVKYYLFLILSLQVLSPLQRVILLSRLR